MSIRLLSAALGCLALVLLQLPAVGQSRPVASRKQQLSNAACALRISASRLYIREATGRNDGPEVEAAQRAAGAARFAPWCGCEQYVEQKACGLPTPTGAAGSYNWFLLSNPRTYFVLGKRGSLDSIRPAHHVGFYSVPLGRIGHIGRVVQATRAVRRGRPARGYIVRAGNTGSGGGRDGAGVYDVFYPASSIYAASNWLF